MATLVSDTAPWKDLKSHVGEIEKTYLRDLMNDADRCKSLMLFLANLIAEMSSDLIFSGKDGWCDQLSVSTMSFQQWNNARIWHHTCFYSFLFMLRKLESKLLHVRKCLSK
ncbi:hypothetical protein Tco_0980721, partial [Tanacetum coccineum]